MPRTYERTANGIMHELQHDLGNVEVGWVFARVFRIVVDPKHRTGGGDDAGGGEATLSHFYGFADQVHANNDSIKRGERIWFKKADHMNTMYFGPVSYTRSVDREADAPRKGDIIAGQVYKTSKGYNFRFWQSRAEPFFQLKKLLLHNTRLKPRSGKLYEMLRLHGETNSADDLYVLARVVLFGDVDLLSSMIMDSPETQERHAGNHKNGYQRQRGYNIRSHPVEFAYLVSMLGRSCEVFDAFRKLLHRDDKRDEVHNNSKEHGNDHEHHEEYSEHHEEYSDEHHEEHDVTTREMLARYTPERLATYCAGGT